MKLRTIYLFSFLFLFVRNNTLAQMDHIRFPSPELYAVEAAPGHIAGGDFNNDGITDFVISSILEGGGNLLISNNKGQYDISRNHQDGEATVALTFDFDKDGWTDYAIVTNKGIRIVKNNQGIGWTATTFFQYYLGFITTYSGPITICSADFDHDNFLETAVAIVEPEDGTQILKLIQNENGSLSEDSSMYSLTDGNKFNYLRSMVSGDFNDDGWVDLAVTFTDDKKLSILLNDGAGGFKFPIIESLDSQAWMAISKDFNKDGRDDIAIGSQVDSSITILFSNGYGHFSKSDIIRLNAELYSINSADLDSDGDNDLFANSVDNLFTSWKNNGEGEFSLWQRTDIGAYSVGYGLMSFRSYLNFVATDLNRDNAIDLVGIFDGNQIGIVYNTGDGLVESPIRAEFPLFAMDHIQIVDFDNNGWKDILGFDGNGKIAAMFNDNGSFSDFTVLDVQPFDASSVHLTSLQSCKIIDFDNDGDEDLVGIYHRFGVSEVVGQLNCVVIENSDNAYTQTCHLFLNHADSIKERYPAAWYFDNVSPIGTADFNADGLKDMAFTICDSLFVLQNMGDCKFKRIQAIDLPSSLTVFGDSIPFRVYDLFAEDVNNDQVIDLIINGELKMYIYQGNASGQFTFGGEFEHPDDPYFANLGNPINATLMGTADFDNNGYPDFVLPIGYYLGLSFFWGNGVEPFNKSLSYYGIMNNGAMPTENDLLTLDFDNDSRIDIAIVNGNPSFRGNNIALFRNVTDDFTMTSSKVYAIGDRPTKGLTEDLNNDGLSDIVVQYDWKKVKILLNKSEEAPPTFIAQEKDESFPKGYHLFQNYPNPFNPTTIINYSIPENSFVTLKVFDILGREVIALVNEGKYAGNYSVIFNGSNFSSGVYLYTIKSNTYFNAKKFILMK